jgi:hypothetical protein
MRRASADPRSGCVKGGVHVAVAVAVKVDDHDHDHGRRHIDDRCFR